MMFKDTPRCDVSRLRHKEPIHKFLARTSRAGAQEIRAYLNELLESFPAAGRAYQERRLKQRSQSSFIETFFELFVAHYLQQLDVSILQVEPQVDNNSCPDFLCETKQGERFYAEVVTIHDDVPNDAFQELEDQCARLAKEGWRATLRVKNRGKPDFNPNDLYKELKEHLQLHAAALRPFCYSTEAGWDLRFAFRRDDARSGRLQLSEPPHFLEGIYYLTKESTAERSTSKLQQKMSKYGDLAAPLIIFANHKRLWGSHELLDILYRELTMGGRSLPDPSHLKYYNAPHLHGGRYPQVESVVLFQNLEMTRRDFEHVRLRNGFCNQPLPGVLSVVPQVWRDAAGQPRATTSQRFSNSAWLTALADGT